MIDEAELKALLARYQARLEALEGKAPEPPGPTDIQVQNRSFTANEGQHCIIECPAAGMTVTLPRARPQNRNARIAFTLRNSNPVRFIAVNGKVNNRTSGVMASPGTFDAISDGSTGWSISVLAAGPTAVPTLSADFVVGVANPGLPNARVATASVEVTPSIAVANVISWALNASSVVFAKLQNLTGLSVLGRAANSAGVMAAITAGGAQQYLRSNVGGTNLEWADPASATVVNTGGQFVRAALTGDVTAAQGLNSTAFRSFSSRSVLANASSVAAIPSDLAGTAAFQHLRVNSTNNGLEWSVLTSGDFPAGTIPLGSLATQASDTFVGNVSGAVQSPIAVALSSLAGPGLNFLAHQFFVPVSVSVVVSGGNVVRAALTGAVTAAQDSNTTAFGALAAKSVLANATNAAAIPSALAGTAAFQHLRVNSTNNALEWSALTTGDFPVASVPLTALATLPTWAQVLAAGNTSAAAGVNNPTIPSGGGSGLIFGADPGGNDQIRSTGQISIAAGSQLILVSQVAGMTIANTLTGVNYLFSRGGLELGQSTAAVPSGPATNIRGVIWNKTQGTGTTRLMYTAKDNATNVDYGLDCTGLTPQLTASTVAALTTVLDMTGRFTVRANTLIAGNRWKCHFSAIFVRGATLTGLNLNCFFGIGVPTINLALAAPITTGTFFLRVEATFTVLTTGSTGTAMAEMMAWCTSASAGTGAGLIMGAANVALALNTTIDLVLVGQCQMNAAVAATSIQASGGNIERVF